MVFIFKVVIVIVFLKLYDEDVFEFDDLVNDYFFFEVNVLGYI